MEHYKFYEGFFKELIDAGLDINNYSNEALKVILDDYKLNKEENKKHI